MRKTDPRIIKTLRQIDAALLENLQAAAFQKISIDMICTSAQINRSTFYKYYRDKFDLLDRYLERTLNEFRQSVATTDFILATPSSIDDLTYSDNFRKSLDFIHAHRDIYRILWNANIERRIYSEMVNIIRSNILSKMNERPSVNHAHDHYYDLYAYLFAANMMSLIRWWFEHEDRVSADEVCRLMGSNMKNGLFPTYKSVT